MNEDRADVRKQRRIARAQRKDEIVFLARLLAEPVGRRWLYQKLEECHIYSTSFTTNALAMAFNEGERNVGLRLVAELTAASPENYLQMLKEVEDERRNVDESRADRDADESGDADSPGFPS